MKKQHLSTDTKATNVEEKVDKHLQDSFPTSDPPSHSPGVVGAPDEKHRKDKNSSHHGGH